MSSLFNLPFLFVAVFSPVTDSLGSYLNFNVIDIFFNVYLKLMLSVFPFQVIKGNENGPTNSLKRVG